MRMRRASVEARPHAARGTSSAETHGCSLGRSFVLVAVPAEMHCFHTPFLSRGSCLAMRCPLPCALRQANLPLICLDLLGVIAR
tara:strand:- start:2532 stop:2783 length:252 start_codon:yes stop_codon:yes gene_type:complete